MFLPNKELQETKGRPYNTIAKVDPALEEEKMRVLADHGYEMMELIGEGGFAKCYKVFSIQYNQIFACKTMVLPKRMQDEGVCTPDLMQNEDGVPLSVLAEIDSLVNIIHPNVITIFNYFQENNIFYMILEYCTGGSVDDIIKNSGPMELDQLVSFARQIITALQKIHGLSIAHRDIKPANILIDSHGRPKLADFGLAEHIGSADLVNRTGGSLPFLAPEYFKSAVYDPFSSDIWALGVTFYVMATGRLPYNFKTKNDLKQQIAQGTIVIPDCVDKSFAEMLRMMLKPFPNKRATLSHLLKHPIFGANNRKIGLQNSCLFMNMPPLGAAMVGIVSSGSEKADVGKEFFRSNGGHLSETDLNEGRKPGIRPTVSLGSGNFHMPMGINIVAKKRQFTLQPTFQD